MHNKATRPRGWEFAANKARFQPAWQFPASLPLSLFSVFPGLSPSTNGRETFLSPEPLGLICNICLNRVGEFARHELTNLSLETLPDTLSLSLTGIRLSPKQAAERWTITEFRRQSNSVCADSFNF